MVPVLVQAWRGEAVESEHTGSVAVVDAQGSMQISLGDVDRPVFPRSAVKALQALPLVESDAAGRLGLTDEELALACASHCGEAVHEFIGRFSDATLTNWNGWEVGALRATPQLRRALQGR